MYVDDPPFIADHIDSSSRTPGIIVRDEAARQKLRKDIGPVGIIQYVEPCFSVCSPTATFPARYSIAKVSSTMT